jgi:hypothetical protein
VSVTILEALQNAQINLVDNGNLHIARMMGVEQLKNAIALLEKGYGPNELVEPLLEAHGSVDNVPAFVRSAREDTKIELIEALKYAKRMLRGDKVEYDFEYIAEVLAKAEVK